MNSCGVKARSLYKQEVEGAPLVLPLGVLRTARAKKIRCQLGCFSSFKCGGISTGISLKAGSHFLRSGLLNHIWCYYVRLSYDSYKLCNQSDCVISIGQVAITCVSWVGSALKIKEEEK